jgi:hypothetical protein
MRIVLGRLLEVTVIQTVILSEFEPSNRAGMTSTFGDAVMTKASFDEQSSRRAR